MSENKIEGIPELKNNTSFPRVNPPHAEEPQIHCTSPQNHEKEPGPIAAPVLSVYHKIITRMRFLQFDPMVMIKQLEKLIAWNRAILTPERFEIISGWFARLGHVMLVSIAGLSLLFWIIAAIKQSNGVYILYGLGYAVLFAVLQYTAHKFMNAGRSLVQASSSRLASSAFLDCLSLLASVTGIMVFIHYLAYSDWSYFWKGIAIWVMCDLISYVALNPCLANIVIARDAAAGEEAIGIISFFVKAFMRIVPIAFGTGITLFFIALLCGLFTLLRRTGNEFDGKTAIDHAAIYACLPFASYIIFALYHLTIDILRSILVIPEKLDQIRDSKGKTGE